jgi:beta-1,4-mannosyl-glycoprotein beta-1,4-N-acetylglucosaminyltransferase
MKIVDAFIFFNELEILKARFEELYDIVDYFVLVEGKLTFTGLSKPLYFSENKHLFKQYVDKVIHIVVDDFPSTDDPWAREQYQRNYISKGVEQLQLNDSDLIFISDVDEIIDGTLVYDLKYGIKPVEFHIYNLLLKLYYYSLEWTTERRWWFSKMVTYNFFKTKTPQELRFNIEGYDFYNAGSHITYYGNAENIITKLKSFSETQDCTEVNCNIEYLNKFITDGKLFFSNENKGEQLIKAPLETNKSLPYAFLKTRIPKIAFTFWEGKQMSVLNYYTLASFSKLNPSFEIIVYHASSEEDFEHPSHVNFSKSSIIEFVKILKIPRVTVIKVDLKKEYNVKASTTPIHNADIIRIMKLYEHGGIWIDLDILFIKPIPPSLLKEEFAVFNYENTIPTGLLLSTPKNKYIECVYLRCKEQIAGQSLTGDYQQFGPNLWRDCYFWNIDLFKNVKVLETNTVYPYMFNEPELFFYSNEDRIQPQTYCIHWYNGNKESRKFIDQFDPNTIDSRRNVFEKYISALGLPG